MKRRKLSHIRLVTPEMEAAEHPEQRSYLFDLPSMQDLIEKGRSNEAYAGEFMEQADALFSRALQVRTQKNGRHVLLHVVEADHVDRNAYADMVTTGFPVVRDGVVRWRSHEATNGWVDEKSENYNFVTHENVTNDIRGGLIVPNRFRDDLNGQALEIAYTLYAVERAVATAEAYSLVRAQ